MNAEDRDFIVGVLLVSGIILALGLAFPSFRRWLFLLALTPLL